MPTVSGSVVLPDDVLPLPPGAVVRVVVEDVSVADASSVPLATSELAGTGDARALPFSVEVPEVDESALCSVRVHVDMSADGTVALGDLVSTSTNPVLTRGHGDHVVVHPRLVT
jgi:uncharacterized lipoprotein YbaY